jgi:hypothetical protein
MILEAIKYALSSKPAGQGSELTEYDKRMYMLNKKYKPMKGYKKFKKMYQENSKSRKVMGDIT